MVLPQMKLLKTLHHKMKNGLTKKTDAGHLPRTEYFNTNVIDIRSELRQFHEEVCRTGVIQFLRHGQISSSI